jgi:hypothetical protein
MFKSLRRYVLDRLGAAPREDVAAIRKDVAAGRKASGHTEQRVVEELAQSARRLAKRLDRIEQRIAALAEQTGGLDTIARTGRLRKIDENVDALVRHAFLNGRLSDTQALLARRFRGLSQHEEDGLTVALFDRVGAPTRRFVEIGAGVNGGNSGFLAKECGWTGVMLEIDAGRAASLRRRFAPAVSVVEARVTRENINELVTTNGYAGDVDLLSIDIDGIDYWVWEHLSACRPRVVIVEYNPFFGADRAIAIPYDAQFNRHTFDVPRAAYYGASLQALVKLGRRKGYRLALLEPRGVNAFFVRDDIATDLPPLSVGDVPIAPEVIADFGHGGIFPLLDRAGLALVEIH